MPDPVPLRPSRGPSRWLGESKKRALGCFEVERSSPAPARTPSRGWEKQDWSSSGYFEVLAQPLEQVPESVMPGMSVMGLVSGEVVETPGTDWSFGLGKRTEFELEAFGTSRTAGYIIHDGVVLMEGEPDAIVAHEDVRRVYLGERFSL